MVEYNVWLTLIDHKHQLVFIQILGMYRDYGSARVTSQMNITNIITIVLTFISMFVWLKAITIELASILMPAANLAARGIARCCCH